MKRTIAGLFALVFCFSFAKGQTNFDKMLKELIDFQVPTVTVQQLKKMQREGKVYLLDAREKEEFRVSHLEGARNIGYEDFNLKSVQGVPKNAPVVVYCTVGYRSGKVVERLQKAGFSQVYNLHGSIFEWVNEGNPVVNTAGKPTKKVHTYDRSWAKYLEKGEKVY